MGDLKEYMFVQTDFEGKRNLVLQGNRPEKKIPALKKKKNSITFPAVAQQTRRNKTFGVGSSDNGSQKSNSGER